MTKVVRERQKFTERLCDNPGCDVSVRISLASGQERLRRFCSHACSTAAPDGWVAKHRGERPVIRRAFWHGGSPAPTLDDAENDANRQRIPHRAGPKQKLVGEVITEARTLWADHQISVRKIASILNVSEASLYREFGPRGTPAFGTGSNAKDRRNGQEGNSKASSEGTRKQTSASARRVAELRPCEVCGQQFSAKQDRIAKGQARFCSKKCSGIGHRKPDGPIPESKVKSFWKKVDTSAGHDACWPWMAARETSGYGLFIVAGRVEHAPRVALFLDRGLPITDGWQARHSCGNPACCNPKHIFPADEKG